MSRSRPSPRLLATALRDQLAQEAARLMIEGGIADFGLAKRKAAERFGVRAAGALPSNAQIQECVAERQRIFEPATHDRHLAELRRGAAEVMEFLAPFHPRLVGSVLAGTPTINATIELHVFADSPEDVAALLERRGHAWRDTQRRFRFGGQKNAQVPVFSFMHGDDIVDLAVFPETGEREAPLSPVDQRPMRRAARGEVVSLLKS